MGKITGTVEVLVNGELLLNKPGASISGIGVSGEPAVERAAIVGPTGLHGFVQNPIMAQCEVIITDRDDIKLSDLASINGDGTIVFRAKGGGKVYTMHNATCLGNFTLTGGEGETTIVFQGASWVETVSET